MAAQAVAAVRRRRGIEAKHPADGGVQAVGRDDVAEPFTIDEHRVVGRTHQDSGALGQRDAEVEGRVAQSRVQRGPTHPTADTVAEGRLGSMGPGEVADADQVVALRFDGERFERGDRTGHQPLAAGLVDRAGSLVPHGDIETRTSGVEGGGETGGPAADDEQVSHDTVSEAGAVASREASASFSTRSRTVSSAALSTVNTTAVIHAECTSGNANPSTTTAT